MDVPIPKLTHDERRARQRLARHLKRLAAGGLPYYNGFGFYDPTPPEAVKLIKAEIRQIEGEIKNDGDELERNERN